MLNIIQKDLIKAFKENEINVLIQQCNVFHTQNAGLAKSIKQEYPEILNVDLATPYGDKNKLGTFSYITPERKNISQTGYIINLYGQYRYGKGLQTDYDAQRTGFKNIVEFLNNRGPVGTIKIGLPLIGCGLAGGIGMLSNRLFKKNLLIKALMFLCLHFRRFDGL